MTGINKALVINGPPHPAGFWVEDHTTHAATANTDSMLFGGGNKGKIEKNTGLRLNSNDSTLEIGSNSNCSVIIRNCSAKFLQNTKGSVDFTDAKISLLSNSHFMIYGHGRPNSYVKFQGNVDFTFEGSKVGDSFFGQNSNVVVVMRKGGGITAKGNTNIKIGGEVQNLRVENVRDHAIHSVTGNEHSFTILKQSSAGAGSSAECAESKVKTAPKLQYELSYIGSAIVEGVDYTVGEFKWKMAINREEQEMKLTFDLGDDSSSLKVEHPTPASVRILGPSSSKALIIKGPSAVSVDGVVVTVSLKPGRASEEKEKPPFVRRLSRRLSSLGLVGHN